jgi:iron complex outermembrane recepter protein
VTYRSSEPNPTFRLSPVAAGTAVLLMALGAAQAQTQPAAPAGPSTQATQTQAEKEKAEKEKAGVQVITVTGIRRGIESAINVKKNSDSIVEAVSAEDIGKLPDVSIAESIARLPGLSAQRVAGRAQVISVRGLSPDFATTLLNGRELVSTGDNRSVEFDQYPSELLASVTVYKTPYADLVGQGLSGTLDMQTVRPLNFGQRTVSVGGRLSRNSLGSAGGQSGNGQRFSVSYIDQFADRTVGVALGFAHLKTPVQEEQVGLYEPWEVKGNDGGGRAIAPGLPPNTFSTGGIKALRRAGETTRDGVMGTIEWRPSKDYTGTLDLFFSRAKQEDTAHQLEMNLNYNGSFACNAGGGPACTWSNFVINDNRTVTSATIASMYPLVRGMYNKREDDIGAVGLNNRFKLGSISLDADISYSKATRDERNLENNTQLTPSPQFESSNVRFNSGTFSTFSLARDYSNLSNLLLRGTIYGSGYGKTPKVEDELTGLKVIATLPSPMSMFADLSAGLSYTDRTKQKVQPEGNITLPTGVTEAAIASDLSYGTVNLGFAGLGNIAAWNVPGAVGRYMVFNPAIDQPFLVAKSWTVDEKITTAFLKANIDHEIGGINMRGNVGLQIQNANQSSDGIRFSNNQTFGVTDSKTTTDILPSLNLAFALGNDQTVRVAVARQVARPRVDQLRASLDFGIDNGTGRPGASGGNTELDPWRANALDISYEKYFGTRAYLAAAFFHKDLRSYIYTQSNENYDFSQFIAGYVPPNTCTVGGLQNQPCPAAQRIGTYTAPYNGKGGKLSGLELSASLPLSQLTPALKGFGVVASASFNDSNIKIDLSREGDNRGSLGTATAPLPGLSKRVYNLTAYYEAGGFEFRISQRKRSDFVGEIGDFSASRKLRYVVGESILDAQLGYNFTEGPLKGLSLTLQANNLNDAAYETYSGTRDRQLEYLKWGRSVMFGANYKF